MVSSCANFGLWWVVIVCVWLGWALLIPGGLLWVEWLLVGGECDHLWPLSLTMSVHRCWPSIMSCYQLFCVVVVVVVILSLWQLLCVWLTRQLEAQEHVMHSRCVTATNGKAKNVIHLTDIINTKCNWRTCCTSTSVPNRCKDLKGSPIPQEHGHTD